MSHKVSRLTGNGTMARMASMTYGYARVSTGDQTTDLQQDALEKAGCNRIFTDVASGAKAHRPELDHMLDLLLEGDTVVVWKLDRLGRSLQNLVELINEFDARGVQFHSLTESIDTSTPGGTLIFNIFGSLAQFERDLIRERTRAGLEAARARGQNGRAPRKPRQEADQGGTAIVRIPIRDSGPDSIHDACQPNHHIQMLAEEQRDQSRRMKWQKHDRG